MKVILTEKITKLGNIGDTVEVKTGYARNYLLPNNGNQIVKTQVLHDDDLKDIKMAKGETDIPAAIELNALEELFNNIGRFSPAGLGQ